MTNRVAAQRHESEIFFPITSIMCGYRARSGLLADTYKKGEIWRVLIRARLHRPTRMVYNAEINDRSVPAALEVKQS